MTEKEKMLAGQNYDSRDPELLSRYHKARALMQSYNTLESADMVKREELLTTLLGQKGNAVWIEAPFYCDYGEYIAIGDHTFINANCFFLDNNHISIGKNGLIGPNVQIYTANHPLKASERILQNEDGATRYLTNSKAVSIGDNVWIGGNTVIMPGVVIGNNVTLGAGSVVTKDIPSDVLAFGNPCKIHRTLN